MNNPYSDDELDAIIDKLLDDVSDAIPEPSVEERKAGLIRVAQILEYETVNPSMRESYREVLHLGRQALGQE